MLNNSNFNNIRTRNNNGYVNTQTNSITHKKRMEAPKQNCIIC